MNPPYNKGVDIDFIFLAYQIAKNSIVAITPAKWQTAEANQKISSSHSYGDFRRDIVPHMNTVVFYPCCKDIFDIYQVDGITYYRADKDKIYDRCTVINKCNDILNFNSIEIRSINNEETLINIGNEIIQYMGNYPKWHFKYWNNLLRYQVYTPNQAGSFNWYQTKEPRYVLAESKKIDTEIGETKYSDASDLTYTSNNPTECDNFLSWINTRFIRFFVAIYQSKLTGMLTDHVFKYVPAPILNQDGTYNFNIKYTDELLYHHYGLDKPEACTKDDIRYIDIIEAIVKERE